MTLGRTRVTMTEWAMKEYHEVVEVLVQQDESIEKDAWSISQVTVVEKQT